MNDSAPGSPGIPPRWTSSDKSGIGTAINAQSRVWFTASHGIINEVYYPSIDRANTSDSGERMPSTPRVELVTAADVVWQRRSPGSFRRRTLTLSSKHPDRATVRRNLILKAMRERGAITAENYEKAKQAELQIIHLKADTTDAPYLVDFIHAELSKDYSEEELMNGGLSVYTTMDPQLQRAAVEAVAKGLTFVQEQFAARDKKSKNPENRPQPQAGLIALNPHTGEIKAMVGGTD